MRVLLPLLLLPLTAFADISFVDDTYTNQGSTQTITGTEPTGTVQNDIVFALATISGSQDGAFTDPVGFVQIDSVESTDGGTTTSEYLGYIVRGASAVTYQFDYSGAASGMALTLFTWRGVDTTTPLDVAYVQANHYVHTLNTPNAAARAITTATNNAWVVVVNYMGGLISGGGGPPSGYTERSDNHTVAITSRGHYVASKLVATAGLETPGVFTHTDVNGTADPRSFTIALKAATTSTSTLLLRRRR